MDQLKLIKKFDKQAKMYERRRRKQDLKPWREKLLRSVSGKVLEVAVGAGANFSYYNPNIEITAVDFSPEMVKRAKTAAVEFGMNAEIIQADVESLTFPPDFFDTIVSTLSLCGYDDPIKVLNLFNQWCKKDGNILLLEHGISSNKILASLQKTISPLAYRLIGCHHNRDMISIIESSDLVIEKAEKHWAGIVHLVWARPDK